MKSILHTILHAFRCLSFMTSICVLFLLFIFGCSQKSIFDSGFVRMVYHDAKEFTIEGQAWRDTEAPFDRLPLRAKEIVNEHVWEHSKSSAGINVLFETDSPTINVRWVLNDSVYMKNMVPSGHSGIDLYSKVAGKWEFVGNGAPKGIKNEATFRPTGNECMLYLPLYNGVSLVQIGVVSSSKIKGSKRHEKTIVWYGTSIVQGASATQPGLAFASMVGRELDVEVINLGISGWGQMYPEMADFLSELDPDLFIIDCIWNMNQGMIKTQTKPFIEKLQREHSDTPILIAEASDYQNRVTDKNTFFRSVCETLNNKNLFYLDNQEMLGTDSKGTVDHTHPNDLGMRRIADKFKSEVEKILNGSKTQ